MPLGYSRKKYPEMYKKGSKLAEQPRHMDTPESRVFADAPATFEPILTENGSREMLPPGTDDSSVGVLDKRFNVPDGWGKIYVTDTQGTSWKHSIPMDNLQNYLADVPGSYVVKKPDTNESVRRWDTVLVAIPPEHVERSRREAKEREDKFHRDIKNRTLPGDNRRMSREEREEASRQLSDSLHASGMIGIHSPTSGLSFDEAAARKKPGEMEAEMKGWRQGNRSFAREADDAPPERERGRNRTMSVPGRPTR